MHAERIENLLFSSVSFAPGQELTRFRYRFTCSILLFSGTITGLFHLAVLLGQSIFDPTYLEVSRGYLVISFLYYFLLRGNPSRLMWLAGSFAALSLGLNVCTLLLDTPDELRIIWFVLNIPGTYLVLGSRVGTVVTVLSILIVIVANPHLEHPYSSSAIATSVLGLGYLSVLFHAYAARSISFHHAMVSANAQLAELAARDPMTGLYNGRAYYSLCDGAFKQAQRTHSPFAMLFVDLDHFKSINDQYGHEAGDLVLKAVAAKLQSTARQSDVVGRIGGEEFSIMLPNTDQDGAQNLAEKIRQEIEALMPDIGPQRLRITASIGVAWSASAEQSVELVQKRADEAMYQAKKGGRNRVTCIA